MPWYLRLLSIYVFFEKVFKCALEHENGFVFSDYFESLDIRKTQLSQNQNQKRYMPDIWNFVRVQLSYHIKKQGNYSGPAMPAVKDID